MGVDKILKKIDSLFREVIKSKKAIPKIKVVSFLMELRAWLIEESGLPIVADLEKETSKKAGGERPHL